MYTVTNLIEDLKKYDAKTKMDYNYIPLLTSERQTHLKEKYDFDLVFSIESYDIDYVTVEELIERLVPIPQNYEMHVDDFGFTYTPVKLVKFKMSHETFKDSNVLTLDSN